MTNTNETFTERTLEALRTLDKKDELRRKMRMRRLSVIHEMRVDLESQLLRLESEHGESTLTRALLDDLHPTLLTPSNLPTLMEIITRFHFTAQQSEPEIPWSEMEAIIKKLNTSQGMLNETARMIMTLLEAVDSDYLDEIIKALEERYPNY